MNKTIYFIVPYPFQKAPSQRFRFEQYVEFLKSQGFKIEIHSFIDESTWNQLYTENNTLVKVSGILKSFLNRFKLLFRLKKADYIFIHREASQVGPPIFEWIIAKILRRKYVYDFDDAIWLPNYSEVNARFQKLKMYWKVNYCMKWANQVVAGNQYLADYARQFNSNVVVIPTTIDTIYHHNLTTNPLPEKVSIGWTGTHTTMNYLDDLIPVLKELSTKYIFDFIVISNEKPNYDLDNLIYIPWNKDTEIEDLAKINIGVMPLKDDAWAEGKCGFKGLQYMALQIPTIMSPVGVNKEIVESGVNGFLASSPEEWKIILEDLIQNPTKRIEIGLAGKLTIDERYSVLANRPKYLALFRK
ncbi:MAG: glycosyltransferase [Crocinitomicaceae bacterium]|nr:glycosyltransferase [Crocinitomicaceae bacterium]